MLGHYAECRYAEWYILYRCAGCCYAECHYAECHYAECRGAIQLTTLLLKNIFNKSFKSKQAMIKRSSWTSFVFATFQIVPYIQHFLFEKKNNMEIR
jgi:hypothetical protein